MSVRVKLSATEAEFLCVSMEAAMEEAASREVIDTDTRVMLTFMQAVYAKTCAARGVQPRMEITFSPATCPPMGPELH